MISPVQSWAGSARQRLSFDEGWQFFLCFDKAKAIETLKSLNIEDSSVEGSSASSKTNKVTDDTEPEQAQASSAETPLSLDKKDLPFLHSFQSVNIPHDWSSYLPFEAAQGGSAGYLAGGQGIYMKRFSLPSNLSAKEEYQIIFDGVYHRSTVWLNGHRLGHHMYGYTGFSFDMTPYLNKKGENLLVVHVDREEQSRWYTGSGIYRHVWIQATHRTHIRENGLSVLAKTDGSVIINAETAHGESFSMQHAIYDAQGKKVAQGKGNNLMVKQPHLWSVDDPYMYKVRTQIRNEKGRLTDEVETSFGFRSVRFDADSGFFLNEKPLKLRGMCLHQDVGSLGVAVSEEVYLRRLKALKEIGCNAIRSSHNPPSSEFLTICDTLGLLVLDEAFDKWKSGYYEPFFDDNAIRDITDMVERDRNHPSVIVWSIGNEVSEAWLKTNEGVERAKMLNAVVKSIDDSRPTMLACQQGFENAIADVADLVGYNYLEPRMLADHKRFPQRKMFVSEAFVYYSGLRENLVRDFVEYNPWNFVKDNDFIAGSFVWAGVDYLGESSPWPAKGWCSCPFDMTLKERPQAAFYHPAWQPEQEYLKLVVRDNCFDQPTGTDHWQYPPMADTWDLPYTDSRCVEIRCYTTCDSVQFFFPMWSNPQLPLKPRVTADYPDHCITLQLPARQGKVLAVGYKDGKEVMRDSLINHGPVAQVELAADILQLQRPRTDFTPQPQRPNTISHIRMRLLDAEGRLQQMQPRKFRVEVEGPLRILGVESGDMRRMESWRTTELTSYFGEGLVRVQSTNQTGVGKVLFYVEGFEQPFVQEILIK
ncbi:MAG: glycoside hydrolase family 2 TIM barrel-domain containing protein [Bacteroidales bacterium]|nr:glycoside hydrolase family 2 TIM barrel-domain containing protein [Bacteroidales bacterium]